MKPHFHPILLDPNESFTCVDWKRQPLELAWTYVSEFIITLINHGRGQVCIGDGVGRFREGDIYLVGPNMPGFWWSDPGKARLAAHRVTVSFRENFLGGEFLNVPETASLRRLLSAARRGLIFPHKVSKQVAPDLIRLATLKGLPRLVLLLDVLCRLASVSGHRFLASAGFNPDLNERDAGRLAAACDYIRKSYDGPVSRDRAAKLAGLSPQFFSNFFHRKMGRTFEHYVTEIRLGDACHLLAEEDLTIAEVAFQTGFNQLTNFHRHFQKFKGMTPGEYREIHLKTELRLQNALKRELSPSHKPGRPRRKS